MEPHDQKIAGPFALGLDAGGTATRWALVGGDGGLVAEGETAGFSALDLGGEGRSRVLALLAELAAEARGSGSIRFAHAGLTGLDGEGPELAVVMAGALGLAPEALTLGSDVEAAYLSVWAPGEGYLVYAGTGSIAAFLDGEGRLHRAGGRGVILDDGGSGTWIAREALRRIWRTEDERPGAWRDSPLAQALFSAMGGADWAITRQAVYGTARGEVGRLALVVARVAGQDPEAEAILKAAGAELARLGRALFHRFGPRPVIVGGRAATLHPLIREGMAATLPPGTSLEFRPCRSHLAAARLALARLSSSPTSPRSRP